MLKYIDGIAEICKMQCVVMDDLREKYPEKFNSAGGMDYKWFEKDIRSKMHIFIRKDVNSISFTLKDAQKNKPGADLPTIIAFLIEIVHGHMVEAAPTDPKESKELIEKHQKVLDNLLFAFKNSKEIQGALGEKCGF